MNSSISLRTKLIVILGVLGASFSAIFVRFSDAPSMVLVLYRLGLAALAMTFPGIKALMAEKDKITKKDILCCCISGFFLAFHFYAYFTSLKLTSISAAVVLVDAEVFFVSFVVVFLFKERISKAAWLGIVITFLGSLVIALGDGMAGGSVKGDLWAVSGAFFVAIYTLMGRICRQHMSTASYTMIVYYVTAIVSFVFLNIQKTPIFGYSFRNVLCALGLTVFSTLLGHSVFSWALKTTSPAYVATVKLLEPVFASLLGILIFVEIPHLYTVIGGFVVIFGVYLAGKEQK